MLTRHQASLDDRKKFTALVKDLFPDQDMYILSTDGFANSYTSDEEYQKTCKDYLQMLQEHGADTVQANLKNWLTETSELGCGDDITVVMVYFAKE